MIHVGGDLYLVVRVDSRETISVHSTWDGANEKIKFLHLNPNNDFDYSIRLFVLQH